MLNKKIKLVVLTAVGLLGLAGCGEIVAKPTDYDSKLVEFSDSTEVYHNVASVVYDAIRDGGVGDEVLNEVLYRYSQSVIGYYSKNVIPAPGEGVVTLQDCVGERNASSTTKTNEFVKLHKAYWNVNEDGKRVDDEGNVVEDSADASPNECLRVWEKWDTIQDRIAKKMYDKISAGTYSDRNIFSEKKLLMSLKGSMCNVPDPLVRGSTPDGLYEGLILPEYEPEQVFEQFLHKSYYMGEKYHYVEEEIIPDLSVQLLTEQYLLDETYNTLGRSYARKVNVITIANNEKYPMMADYVANSLVNKICAHPDVYKEVNLTTFKDYSNVLIGVDLTQAQLDIISDINNISGNKVFKPIEDSDPDDHIYEGTEYGDMETRYNLIKDNPTLNDSAVESDFTGNNAYPKEVGHAMKLDELRLKKHTTTGWFIKNGGLSELPDSVRSRLFNIGVANGVKETVGEQNDQDRWQFDDDQWVKSVDESENAYVARINGKYYLKNSTRINVDDDFDKDILHYDADSKTYYIVQIEEAASSSKLSKTSIHSYRETRGAEKMEEIINAVTELVGVSESYSTLAKKHYLKEMNLAYHDQAIYDFFKSNYPELFE